MIGNWKDQAIKFVSETWPERRHDSRFPGWVKKVTSVNSLTNGYCFEGEFINDGTTDLGLPAVLLVLTTNGSRANHVSHYSVIRVDVDGKFSPTDIYTDGRMPGWALRIRDQVAELLNQKDDNPLATIPTAELVAELRRRGIVVSWEG